MPRPFSSEEQVRDHIVPMVFDKAVVAQDQAAIKAVAEWDIPTTVPNWMDVPKIIIEI